MEHFRVGHELDPETGAGPEFFGNNVPAATFTVNTEAPTIAGKYTLTSVQLISAGGTQTLTPNAGVYTIPSSTSSDVTIIITFAPKTFN